MLANILSDYEVATEIMTTELERIAKRTLALCVKDMSHDLGKNKSAYAALHGQAVVAQNVLDDLLLSLTKHVQNPPKILDTSWITKPADEKTAHIDITIPTIKSARTSGYIYFHPIQRPFFPAFGAYFVLETDIGDIRTHVITTGTRLQTGLKPWWAAHPELEDGAVLSIIKIGSDRYKLDILRTKWPLNDARRM